MGKVICPGELLIDFICTDHDQSLKQGMTFIKKAGGAPANAAVAIQKMGAEAYVLSCVGNDQFGEYLIDVLNGYNVNTTCISKNSDFHTTLAFVSLESSGERDFSFNRGADEKYSIDMINQQPLNDAEVFHFGSATAFLGGELRDTYYYLLNYAIKNNKIISVDPNYREALFGNNKSLFIKNTLSFIKHADLLKVSDMEAKLLTNEVSVGEAARTLNKLGAKYVLVTLGREGTLISSLEKQIKVSVEPVKMVDATGAGDAFIGSVLADISSDVSLTFDKLIDYVTFANKVGAMTVQSYGALESVPYKKDVTGN